MATHDEHDPQDANVPETPDVPYEFEAEIEEARPPRRAASAEFVIDSGVGSEAMLREAMDPANQSLAEALRLSFRVLQVVILVLVVLFIFSGFQTVEEGQTGVQLRWGRILERDGEAALQPGLKFSKWPYPAGEFVLFQEKDRRVGVGDVFWPSLGDRSFQEAVNAATENQQLRPGRDGSVLTRGGDIAHIRLESDYDIESPERFVRTVENAATRSGALDADAIVQLSLARAAVHFAARSTLQEVVEIDEVGKAEIRGICQNMLDTVDVGIRVSSVEWPIDPTPAFAIKRSYDELQESKVLADKAEEDAREAARRTLINMAGAEYAKVVELISAYEDAVELNDNELAEQSLVAVNAQLESPETQGEVTEILNFARSYSSLLESTIGREAKRFQSLIGWYRQQPELAVRQLWMETYANVLSRPDAEVFYVPPGEGRFQISISGQDFIRQERLDQKLNRETLEVYGAAIDPYDYVRRAREYKQGPGRQLAPDAKSLQR